MHFTCSLRQSEVFNLFRKNLNSKHLEHIMKWCSTLCLQLKVWKHSLHFLSPSQSLSWCQRFSSDINVFWQCIHVFEGTEGVLCVYKCLSRRQSVWNLIVHSLHFNLGEPKQVGSCRFRLKVLLNVCPQFLPHGRFRMVFGMCFSHLFFPNCIMHYTINWKYYISIQAWWYIITTGDPLTAVPNVIYDSSSYLSLLI